MTYLDSGAYFSPDRVYRYTLWRNWEPSKPICAFIGLNPSIADEVKLDPTVRRCIGYAKRWGCGKLIMLNAFAFVSGDPKRMMAAADPVGQENDAWLVNMVSTSQIVVVAWSGLVTHRNRHEELRKLLRGYNLHVLGWTKTGHPRHPLYMKADCELQDFWHERTE